MEDNQDIEDEGNGEENVPLAWGSVGGNPPPPPPPTPPARPSVEPPATPQPWAQEAAASNPLRNPQPPPATPLGQSIGATPPLPPVPPVPQAPAVPPVPQAPLSATPPTPPAVTPPALTPPTVSPPPAFPPPDLSSAGSQTVVSPSAEPVLSGDYGVTAPPVAPEAGSSSSKLPWILAVVGALVLLGGGGFFAVTAFSSTGGADTPEAAVDSMFEAISNEDFVTMGELIEPSERRTIVEPTITQILPELQRLDILSDSADAGDVEGVDFEITDLTYRVEPIIDAPDMVHVYLTGGEFASEFNAAEFPFSDSYREFLGDDLQDEERTVEAIEPSETPLTFVQRDGKWYFSGWFSIAESIRLEEGGRLPLASEAPPALGSDSPEAAVEAMFDEMVELDLAGMIGRMDPEELAVLYRYSPLFLEDGQAGLDEFRQLLNDENVAWDLRDFDFDVNTDGDEAVVEMRAFTFDITAPQGSFTMTYGREAITGSVEADQGRGSLEATTTRWQISGVIEDEAFNLDITIDPDTATISGSGSVAGETGSGEFSFDPNGVCSRYSVSVGGETEEGCLEDDLNEEETEFFSNYETVFADWPTEFPGISISAHRTDGEWYVSPISTMFDGMISILEQFEDGQFEAFTDSAMMADPLSGANDFENILEGAMDEAMNDGGDDDIESVLGAAGGAAEQDTVISLNIERGAVAEIDESIDVGTYDLVLVDLEAGDTITTTVRTSSAGSLDSLVTLRFEETGDIEGSNDDADISADLPSSLDSQLEVVVSQTGTYEIRIGSYDDGSGGDYNVTIERS